MSSGLSPLAERLLDAIVNGTTGTLRERINALRDYIATLERETRRAPAPITGGEFTLRPSVPAPYSGKGYVPFGARSMLRRLREPTRIALDRAGGATSVANAIGASDNAVMKWNRGEISVGWALKLATVLGQEWFDLWQDAAEEVAYFYADYLPNATISATTPNGKIEATDAK